MRSCPEDAELVVFLDGQATEERAIDVRAHLRECAPCRERLREIEAIRVELARPIEDVLGGSATAFADEIDAKIDRSARSAAVEKRTTLRFWGAMMVAAAIPLAIGVGFGIDRARSSRDGIGEWTARGGGSSSGPRQASIQLGKITTAGASTAFEPIGDGAVIGRNEILAAEVGVASGERLWLLSFLVDASGERHWIYPAYESSAAPPSAVPLPKDAVPRVLSTMVRLDSPPEGDAVLFAVILAAPESVVYVENARASDLTPAELTRHYPGALVVSKRVRVEAR